MSFRPKSVGLTHVGMVRSANEDSMVLREDAGVWVVADGMGGHENGQWASTTIVEAVGAARLTGDFDADVDAVGGAILAANETIYRASVERGRSMGSTVTALYLNGDRFVAFWAGDSRIYLLRAGRLHQLSRDHTQVMDLVERGLMSPEEAEHHPMGHVLSRAVGTQETLELDAVSDTAVVKDVFLLCSDGLTGVVSEEEIADRLGMFPPEVACRRLLELVLARGAPDNVTMVAVACEELTALAFAPAF
ncbi:MAG TPA: protein phosphatase 2C domain-containing protein [Caulobacteraceae bacterium]|jgi:serine/threonine protein phosphatase PrpC